MKFLEKKTLSYWFLLFVPFVVAALGFGVGHVSYKIYLPLWLLNIVLMTMASWSIGLKILSQTQQHEKKLAAAAFFLIIPWIVISMFAGLGPPPETAAAWTAAATEQQVRYCMLVIAGVLIVFGFAGVRERFKTGAASFYFLVSFSAILIAIPLFIMNMLYWGFYLTELFRMQSNTATAYPEWFLPVRKLFGLISVTEVALTYFATLMFALALKTAGWLSRSATIIYVIISFAALAVVTLSVFFKEVFEIPGYAVAIPAFPFLMPYLMGVNLLRKAGNVQ